MGGFDDLIHGFLSLSTLIEQSLEGSDPATLAQLHDLTSTFCKRLLCFILTANSCDLTISFTALKTGIKCLSLAELSQDDHLKFMQMVGSQSNPQLNDCSSWKMDAKNRESLLNIFNMLFDKSSRVHSPLWTSFAVEKLKLLAHSHAEAIGLAKSGTGLRELVETQLKDFIINSFGLENPGSKLLVN